MAARRGRHHGALSARHNVLHIIFASGLRAIREQAEQAAYASAAADRIASGDLDEARRMARRRRPSWADED